MSVTVSASELNEGSADTHTMTIFLGAKIDQKMAPNGPKNRSPGEYGTDLCSIFQMLRKSVPH